MAVWILPSLAPAESQVDAERFFGQLQRLPNKVTYVFVEVQGHEGGFSKRTV